MLKPKVKFVCIFRIFFVVNSVMVTSGFCSWLTCRQQQEIGNTSQVRPLICYRSLAEFTAVICSPTCFVTVQRVNKLMMTVVAGSARSFSVSLICSVWKPGWWLWVVFSRWDGNPKSGDVMFKRMLSSVECQTPNEPRDFLRLPDWMTVVWLRTINNGGQRMKWHLWGLMHTDCFTVYQP